MTALFAMPDDPAAIPAWLDRQVLGPELPALVEELRAVHRPGPPPHLDAVLGEHRAAFLAGGFAAVPRGVRSTLLRNPDLLADLPALVFAGGGDFWFADPPSPAEEARIAAVTANVRAALAAGPPAEPRRPRRSVRWLGHVGACLATAAAVLVAVYLGGGFRGPSPPPVASGWGFAKVQELPREAGPKAVYAKLADLADEWGKKPTDDRLALAKRLTEFRLGCSALQAADLPLSDAENRWVKGRCTEWAARIDGHLRALDATGDAAAVRAAANATAADIALELRERAAAV